MRPNIYLLFLLLLHSVSALNGASPHAVQHVVFTRWSAGPYAWRKHVPSRLKLDSPRWLRADVGVSRDFNFLLLATSLRYVHFAPVSGDYVIRLGIYSRIGCSRVRRPAVFIVNGVSSGVVNGAASCGCGSKFYVDIPIKVGANRRVVIEMHKVPNNWNPTVSNFQLFKRTAPPEPFMCKSGPGSTVPTIRTPKPTLTPTTTPSLSPGEQGTYKGVNINVNAGIGSDGMPVGTNAFITKLFVSVPSGPLPRASFSSLVQGEAFSFRFQLPPGFYTVRLGFAELVHSQCESGARVFNVLIAGRMRLEAYDVYAAAGGACRKAVVETFYKQVVDAVGTGGDVGFEISFVGVAGLAAVSHIRIEPSLQQCVPVAGEISSTADHFAHAVPGTYPPDGKLLSYVDRSGPGFVWVTIDGSDSHTHFSYRAKSGRITSYIWTFPETGKVVSTRRSFDMKFLLGTTRLRLTVTDDACTSDEAETSIAVTGKMQPGAYCYFYGNIHKLPLAGSLTGNPHPQHATIDKSLTFSTIPAALKSKTFVARCVFFLEFPAQSEETHMSIKLGAAGNARLYKGLDLILDTNTSPTADTSTTVGFQQFEVLYHHKIPNANPWMSFRVNGTLPTLTHDQSTVMPIISSITPRTGRAQGGGRVRLSGYGLYSPLTVSFGVVNLTIMTQAMTPTIAFVTVPPGSGVAEVSVTTNADLTSNAEKYWYDSTCDAVRFSYTSLTMTDGSGVELGLPTTMVMWQDGKLYVGTRGGRVHVVEYDYRTLTVINVCHSETIRDPRYVNSKGMPSPRTILGMEFHPADKSPHPYISLSTLYWHSQQNIALSNKRAWANGVVARLKPATTQTKRTDPKQCLQFDKNIVRNLPVSNRDHALNAMVFTQEGDLLISVGGNTNAGLPGYVAGGIWESYFSASVVIAKLSRGKAFDGDIKYTTPDNLRTAKPIGTNVNIYATGLRNMFAMSMNRAGRIYGVDMGPNCKAGNASTTCSEYKEADAQKRTPDHQTPFPGLSNVGGKDACMYGPGRWDKLVCIQKRKFYGHPNLQRAKLSGQTGECGWIDPNTDKTGLPSRFPPPNNYVKHIASVRSAMTGLREYGANLFCGRLRSFLILSKFKASGVSKVQLSSDGKSVRANGAVERFDKATGGLAVEENAHGDLIFSKYHITNDASAFYVMRPVVSDTVNLNVANVVPFRHGKNGGTTAIIGGWGFEEGVSVLVGGKNCTATKRTVDEIRCIVPAHNAGPVSVDVTVNAGGISVTVKNAILYMRV